MKCRHEGSPSNYLTLQSKMNVRALPQNKGQGQRNMCTADTAGGRLEMRYVNVHTFNLRYSTQLPTWPTEGNDGQQQELECGGSGAHTF